MLLVVDTAATLAHTTTLGPEADWATLHFRLRLRHL